MKPKDLTTLSKNLLVSMVLGYNLIDILNLCRTSKRFNRFICQNDAFWINKTLRDYGQFGHIPKILNKKYKKMYNEKIIWKDYYKLLHGITIDIKYQPIVDVFIGASRNGRVEMVKILLNDNRVDPSARNNEAITWASENGNLNIARLLLADPRTDPSTDDNLPIKVASEKGNLNVVRLLLADFRTDPSAEYNWAIKAADKNGHIEVVRLLLTDPRVRGIKKEF